MATSIPFQLATKKALPIVAPSRISAQEPGQTSYCGTTICCQLQDVLDISFEYLFAFPRSGGGHVKGFFSQLVMFPLLEDDSVEAGDFFKSAGTSQLSGILYLALCLQHICQHSQVDSEAAL